MPFDFSEIKQKTKKLFKSIKENNYFKKEKGFDKSEIEKEGNFQFDFNQIKKFTKNNSKWLIPVLLILIAISVSTYLRMMPAYLPVTDDWAEMSLTKYYKDQIGNQIGQQYPNLPQQNRDTLVEKEYQNFLQQNKQQIEQDTALLSQQYKAQFQDENSKTYLLEADPYLWYSEARNVINYGHLGDKLIDGKSYFTLRDGRLDKEVSFQLHPYVCVYMYKFLHFFNRDLTLMKVMFLMPVILIGLAIIPTFFIGRKIAGNVGGFFAAIFFAINGPLLGRTIGGFSDTDGYTVLCSILVTWMFLEAYTNKNKYFQIGLIILSGLFVGIFAVAWGGWSFIFYFILGTIVVTVCLKLIVSVIKNKYKFNLKILKEINLKRDILFFFGFIASSAIFVSLFQSFKLFLIKLAYSLGGFATIKETSTIWPKVQTTVAEYGVDSLAQTILQLGGKIMVLLAVIGLLLTLRKKNEDNQLELIYFGLMLIWFVGAGYSLKQGTRFLALLSPIYAFALGMAFGTTYEKGSNWLHKVIHINKKANKMLILVLLVLILIIPFSTSIKIAKTQIPMMNDAWYNTLIKIKQDSTDSIITTWWDFGHWFPVIAERRVTFDGGDQKKRIYWVGKLLVTSNEAEAIGILRMLNCAQEKATEKLTEFTADELRSIKILEKVLPLTNQNVAKQEYIKQGLTEEQAEIMLNYTHCNNLLPNYFIVSGDMVNKAPAWAHFGLWNFEKVSMYESKNLLISEAILILKTKFKLSEEEANKIYVEMQLVSKENWAAPWPGYLSSIQTCDQIVDTKLHCSNFVNNYDVDLEIDLKSYDVTIKNNPNLKPNSIVYATKEKIEQKIFTEQTIGYSVVLIPFGDGYQTLITDPYHAASTFTKLFYFNGHGMKCFSKFVDVTQITGERIITWKVDYNCQQENKAVST